MGGWDRRAALHCQGAPVLPEDLPHGNPAVRPERVRPEFEHASPGRRIARAEAIGTNGVGGGLHCATLTQP